MVQITEVLTHKQLKTFVELPNKMYRKVPEFVPATYGDDMEDWNPKKNPAFAYCEARCWLALRDGKPVGRIGAIISHRANEKWHTNRMRFTQMDFIDDKEVSAALLRTVEDWAREKGCEEVHGPLGFTDLDREGLLVDGYDRRGLFFTYYNPPYYSEHLKELGYDKDVDWVENLITLPKDDDTSRLLKRISDMSLRRHHLHLTEPKRRSEYKKYIPAFFKLVNECYAPLYSTVELDNEQILRYTKKFAPLINPKLCALVMDENNEMVAFGVGAPDLGTAMQKSQGKLLPFGWARMLYALNHNDTVDLLLIGVRPDYQGKAVNAIVMNKILEGCHAIGITKAETGPTLELNKKVLAQWEKMERVQHKRRRCFIKKI